MCVHVAQSYKATHRFHQVSGYRYDSLFAPSRIEPYVTAGQQDLVIAASRQNEDNLDRFITICKWGIDTGQNFIFNARFETLDKRPMWRESAESQRILIPVDGFYERGYYIRPTDPEKSFALAGITVENHRHLAVVVTRDAIPAIAKVHGRMPVLVPKNQWDDWLNPSVPFSKFVDLRRTNHNVTVSKAGESNARKVS